MLRVGACLVLLFAVATASWPPLPSDLPYCNPDPAPIPPLGSEFAALNPKLEMVNAFIRHGDRTLAYSQICWPDDAMDWDCKLRQLQHTTLQQSLTKLGLERVYRLQYMPGREEEKGDCGIGQLTDIGYHQHLINGAHLRQAYVEDQALLPETYETDPSLFFLRADNSRRTQMSGQALFSGLYPAEAEAAGKTSVFPFYTRDETVDDILPNPEVCPLLTEAKAAAAASPEGKEFAAEVATFQQELAGLLDVPSVKMVGLWDCMHVHICHQFEMPEVLTEPLFNKLVNMTFFSHHFPAFYNHSRVARLGQGPLIAEMYGNMQAIRNGTENPVRFWLYSGHDTGPIMPMLSAFNVPGYKAWCPYASLIVVEMYSANTTSGYAARFIYNGEAVTLPGCDSELCDYFQFAAIMEDIIPSPADCGLE